MPKTYVHILDISKENLAYYINSQCATCDKRMMHASINNTFIMFIHHAGPTNYHHFVMCAQCVLSYFNGNPCIDKKLSDQLTQLIGLYGAFENVISFERYVLTAWPRTSEDVTHDTRRY